MPVNPYVNWWTSVNEQNLLNSLMTEAIRFYGTEIVYLPRTLRREDSLYSEDVLSQFTQTYPIEVYLKDAAGWQGQGSFLDKFGLQMDHTITVMLSTTRFAELIPLTRPTEGDWIYFPAPFHKIFEVKFVESEKGQGQFYPLGTRTFYELQLELFTYNHEEIRTGNTTIDIFESLQAYAQDLVMAAGGTGTYTTSETVYQGASSNSTATGVVSSWTSATRTLRITDITGEFANAVAVTGQTSGAIHTLGETPDVLDDPNDPVNDNRYLADTDGGFINTTEGDPFGGG